MAKPERTQPDAAKRKWFDLATVRGWIEAGGALVGVIGAAVGLYLQLYPGAVPDGAKPSPALSIAQSGQGNVAAGRDVLTFNISGYTIEEHEKRLKAREAELRAEYRQTAGRTGGQQAAVERELQSVIAQLGDIEGSYRSRLSELKQAGEDLKRVSSEVPPARIRQAVDALQHGDTGIGETIVAQVEGEARESEPNDQPLIPNVIELGKWVSGDIGGNKDVDYYSFATPPTHRDYIEIELKNRSASLRPRFDLYNANKVYITHRSTSTPGADLSYRFVTGPASKYYLRAGNYDNGTSGEYRIRVSSLKAYDAFEPNGTVLEAREISIGSPVEADIMDGGDLDYYRIRTGATGGQLLVSLENRSATLRPRLDAYNGDKAYITHQSSSTPGANLSLRIPVEASTDYFIRAGTYEGGTSGAYTLNVAVK